MFPILPLLAAVLAATAAMGLEPEGYPFPDPGRGWVPILLIALAIAVVPGEIVLAGVRRKLRSREPDVRGVLAIVRRSDRFFGVLPVLSFVVVLFVGRFAEVIGASAIGDWVLLDEVIVFLPFLLASAAVWIQALRIERHVRPVRRWRSHLARKGRLVVAPLLPLAALVTFDDLGRILGLRDYLELFDYVGLLLLILFVGVLFLVAPFLIRFALDTRSLPPGAVRDELEGLCRRIGFRCRDILVWRTDGRILNAAVVGLTARLRYVLVTDLLLWKLDPGEVRAVFAHEAAHARNGHPWLLLLFAAAFLLVVYPLGDVLASQPPVAATLVLLAVLAVYWVGLFGFLSRRIEREADLDGAFAAGGPGGMVRALRRIEALHGSRPGWLSSFRHYSNPRRVETLLRGALDPGLREAARRTRRRLFLFALVLAVAGASWTATRIPRRHAEGRVRLAFHEERFEEAGRLARTFAKRYPREPWFVFMQGYAALEQGRRREALELFRRALALEPDPRFVRVIRGEIREIAPPGGRDGDAPAPRPSDPGADQP